MPEVSFQAHIPWVNPDLDSDCQFLATSQIDTGFSTIAFGRSDDKAAVNRGVISSFDCSTVPMGLVTINRAKIEMKAVNTDTGAFTADFDVIQDSRLRPVTSSNMDLGINYKPSDQVFPVNNLWTNLPASYDSDFVRICSIRKGIGDIGQAWTCNATTTLNAHWVAMWRTGTTSGAEFRVELSEAVGSAGSYGPGKVLSSSIWIDADTDLTTTPGQIEIQVPSANTAVTSGSVYFTRWVFRGGSGAESIQFEVQTAPPSSDNVVVYGSRDAINSRLLEGFGGFTRWARGDDIQTATETGTTDSITVPDMTAGSVYGFGAASYSSGNFTTLANFTANIQAALRARTSPHDFIGVRIQDFAGVTDDREREIHGMNSSTTTVGSLKGIVLTLDYDAPTHGVFTPPRRQRFVEAVDHVTDFGVAVDFTTSTSSAVSQKAATLPSVDAAFGIAAAVDAKFNIQEPV